MSWTAGESFVRQMGDAEGSDAAEQKTKTIAFKGEWPEIVTAKDALAQNDVIETGWLAKTWNAKQIPGGWGELTIECAPPDPTETDPETQEKQTLPLEDLWTLRSCRNDVSVMAYCGESPGNNPNRSDIEMWMKETVKDLYDAYQFKDDQGVECELSEPSQALAAKIRKGVQSVMRFYPMLTRKRVYSDQPPKCLENLGCIDTPPTPGEGAKKPGGVDAAIAAHQWLKCQDDATQRSDSKWERTESWMGIAITDAPDSSPWDENLYGTTNRWTMPYNLT